MMGTNVLKFWIIFHTGGWDAMWAGFLPAVLSKPTMKNTIELYSNAWTVL